MIRNHLEHDMDEMVVRLCEMLLGLRGNANCPAYQSENQKNLYIRSRYGEDN